jgi:hypothetical protein
MLVSFLKFSNSSYFRRMCDSVFSLVWILLVFGRINAGFMPNKPSYIFMIRNTFLVFIGVERKGN